MTKLMISRSDIRRQSVLKIASLVVVHPQVHCKKYKIPQLRNNCVWRESEGRDCAIKMCSLCGAEGQHIFHISIAQSLPPDPLGTQLSCNFIIYLLAHLGEWTTTTPAPPFYSRMLRPPLPGTEPDEPYTYGQLSSHFAF